MKVVHSLCLALLCFGPLAPSARAQERVSPALRRLEFLVGRATLKEQLFPAAQDRQTDGPTHTASWVTNGRFLEARMKRQPLVAGGSPVETLNLIGYDPQAQEYRMWQFTSGLDLPREYTGRWVGDKVVFTSKPGGSYAGTGVRIDPASGEDRLVIGSVTPNGPAAKSGIKPGDVITRIEGKTRAELGEDANRNLLRGAPNTTLRLTIRSGGQEREVALTREVVPEPTVRYTLAPRTGGEYTLLREAKAGEEFQKVDEALFALQR